MTEHFEVEITDAVILDVTERVLTSFDEIHSMSKRFFDGVVDGISQKLGQKRWPGMNIKHKRDDHGEAFIEINLYLRLYDTCHVLQVTKQIQQQIRQDLRNMLDLYRVRVDVHIDGLERKETSNEPS